MNVFRRRALPPTLAPIYAAFEMVLDSSEAAKTVLVSSVPHARVPGRPLQEAIGEFHSHLALAAARMAPWRCPETQEAWDRCDQGVARSLGEAAEILVSGTPELSFDAHLELVQELLDPLDAFEDAEARFRELRV